MVLLLLLLTILLLTILDDGRATKRELPDSPRVLRVDEYQVVGFSGSQKINGDAQNLRIGHMMQHCKQYCEQIAELHRVSTFAIVACNIARNVAGVEASSTSATFHTTTALCVCLLQHCTQWCDVTKSF